MAEKQNQRHFISFGEAVRRSDVIFALGLVSILLMLLMPMPKWLLDISLAFSITLSVLILFTSIFILKPLDFSSFPTILLVATMLRLSLNVASTRLILTDGHEGAAAAGQVIQAFGGFLMGDNFMIGIILFIILVIINFIVITKGSGRIAEVSARFSLDSLPGKQMAIDADLSAGLVTETEAKDRRKELENESSFFGAMDGASKFVRGDAIAGIMITGINVVGGIVIGITHGLTFQQAAHTYTLLTVGDGLVSQVPALIVSTAAGMLVSKAGVEGSADKAIFKQLSAHPVALGLSSFLMMAISFLPGVPKVPFFFLAFLTGAGAWYTSMRAEDQKQEDEANLEKPDEEPMTEMEKLQTNLKVDPTRIELGYSLLGLANKKGKNNLPDQIKMFRQQIATEMGFIIPSVRLQDNLQIQPQEYIIYIKDVESGRGELRPNQFLTMDPGGNNIMLDGEATKDPTFGIPAMWIKEDLKNSAEEKGYTVVDACTVLMTHFGEVIKENISEILSYQDTKELIDTLEKEQEKLVKDLIPDKVSIGMVQRVLQNLLREKVSVRDLSTILEGIAEMVPNGSNVTQITEHVRGQLARQICSDYVNDEGILPVIHLSPSWQQIFQDAIIKNGDVSQLAITPTDLQNFIQKVREVFDKHTTPTESPVLLTSAYVRPYVRSIIERFKPMTPVLSQNEIHPKIRIRTITEMST